MNWKQVGKEILNNSGYSSTRKNLKQTEETSSEGAGWRRVGKKILDNVGYTRTDSSEEEKKEKIFEYHPSLGLTKDEYNRRRASDRSLPKFGSYEYFVRQEKEVGKLLDEANQKVFDYNDDFHASLAESYENNPEVLKKQGLYDEGKKAYRAFKTQEILAKEYEKIIEYKNKFNETKGINRDETGKIDVNSGKKEAREERKASKRLRTANAATSSDELESYLTLKNEAPDTTKKKANTFYDNLAKENLAKEKENAYQYYEENQDNRYKDNLVGRVRANARSGDINQKISTKSGKAAYDFKSDDLEATEVYQALQERLREKNTAAYQNNTVPQAAVAVVSEYLPQWRDQTVARVKGYAVGALAGLAFGGAAGIKEGARSGGATASGVQMFNQTAGAVYVDLLQKSDLSPEEAHRLATNTAIASSAVEFGLEYAIGGMFKSGKKIINKVRGAQPSASKALVSELAKENVSKEAQKKVVDASKKAGRAALKILGSGVGEGTEEGLQSIIEKGADRIAKTGGNTDMAHLLWESVQVGKLSDDDWKEIGENAAAGAFLGLGSSAVNSGSFGVVNKLARKASGYASDTKVGEAVLSDESLTRAVIYNGKNSKNPQTQKIVDKMESDISGKNKINVADVGKLAKQIVNDGGGFYEEGRGEAATEESHNSNASKQPNDFGSQQESQTVETTNGVTKPDTGKNNAQERGDFYDPAETGHFESPTASDNLSANGVAPLKERLEKMQESVGGNFSRSVSAISNQAKYIEKTVMKKVGAEGDNGILLNVSADFLSTPDQLFTKDFVNAYADYYISALKQQNSTPYFVDEVSQNEFKNKLIHYAMTGDAGDLTPDNRDFHKTAENFRDVLLKGIESSYILRSRVYQTDNSGLEAQMAAIRSGNIADVFSSGEEFEDAEKANTIAQQETASASEPLESVIHQPTSNQNNAVLVTSDNESVKKEGDTTTNDNNADIINHTREAGDLKLSDIEESVETPESVIKNADSVTEKKYSHLYDEEKAGQDFINAVDGDMLSFIDKAVSNQNDSSSVYVMSKTTNKLNRAINELTGIDTTLFNNSIKANSVRHIIKDHGVNGLADKSMSNVEDIARMGYVIQNFEDIELLDATSKEYRDKNQQPAKMVKLSKRIDGTYYVVEAVPDTKAKSLAVVSAYIKKTPAQQTENVQAFSPNVRNDSVDTEVSDAAVGSQVPNADNSPQPTSETPLVSSSASDNSIAQDSNVVNSSERNTGNSAELTDKCELIATKHTATGDDIWVVTLKDRLSSEEYKDLRGKVKAVGGYYSRFAKTPAGKAIPGFVFRVEPTAKELSVFNDFFGHTKETAPPKNQNGIKEIGVEDLSGDAGNEKHSDEIKLPNVKKQNSAEQVLNNQSESGIIEEKKDKDGVKDVHNRVLARESGNDDGVRKSEFVPETEEKRNTGTENREFGEDVASKSGKHIQPSEAEAPATGQHSSRDSNDRVRKSDNSDGNSRTGIDGNDNVDVTENSGRLKDFVITRTVAEDIDRSAPSMSDNIKAIETLHAIEKSGKAPTKTQQGLLAKFKGWGGLAGSFYGESKTKLQELMSESELKAAQSTVNDAYFTPTGIIDGIYKALSHLGFEGGNILEPSMGIGNFFGKMPKAIKENSSLFGVEIDSVSGRIARYLYPSANIEIAPFQDVAYKDGVFDLIVGNVPFGEVKYNYKGKKYLIHDYFFVKAMDKLNDGGILMFLTTKGTLDKLDSTTRTELSNRGILLGAYRLPSNVFTKNAGASVVTDLIVMQKTSGTNGESFINLGTVDTGNGEFSVNEYFVNHPENIIGKLTSRKDWRSGKSVLDVTATGNAAEQLVKAMRKLPKNLLSGVQTVSSVNVTENNAPVQTFSVTENDTVEYIDTATSEVKQIKGKSAKAAKDYVALKEVYQELIDATLSDYETDFIESKRKALNAEYDSFVKKHGTLEKNKKLLSADNEFYKMSGLEVYDTKTKKIVKSEMFTKDTLGKRKPKKADNVLDALSISIGETGGVNVNRIADLAGISESEAIKQLDDRIVYTPDGTYELNEVYLSGNVREKYEAVKGKNGFEKNAKMLEAVIPKDIPAKDITPQFGSPWIKPGYVADFLKETLHLYTKPVVNYDPTSGTWSISSSTWGDNTLLTNKYGTKYMDAIKIAEKALNMRRIVVTDKNTKKMLIGETRAAQQKAEDIKAAFEEWCFKDADRRKDLVATFNRKFNSNRNMDFSELAKYLTFDNLTDTFKLRNYQKRAVARAVFNGNTLLAHGVGTGKTAEMISIAMELKRMNIAKKNMMVVPNHKVADFRNDILKMYPSAKVAYLEKGANSVQRQRFYALVASNDFDIAIIPHSAFGMLDVSVDTKKAFINNQIAELEEVLTSAQAEKGKIDGRFISTLENQKKRLGEKLKFVTGSAKDSGNVFEELGIDSLFVDEAHNFKNLPFYSKLSRVAGVAINQANNKTRASRAENMFMITDYLNRNGGRITFGTATPITNSMSEIYNMIRFLRPDILADSGLQSFDAWASMFGSIVNQAEVDPSGRNMRMKERFSKFKNVSQMIEQFRRMADILKTGDVIQELPEAERIDVYSKPNKIQEEFLDIIDKMIDDIRANGQRAGHNMLEVTTAGQMAAIDLRLVASYFDGKYSLDELNLPNNRTSQVAQKVYKEYVDSNETKGTQFIFCDKGVHDNPGAKYGFYVYGDLINKLVALGIPRNEIAVAQEFKDKADLSARVNTGEIRVLIGSTAVMGEGMNAQNKAVALHHMTVPDRPSDIEQREGRIIRYGNENKNVRIYRYIQEKSYDSYQWQMQERKAAFINQALSGGTVSELEEMSDFQLSAREAKAIASGNPLLLEKIEIEDRLSNLKSLRNKFNTDKLEMQDRLAVLPNEIAKKEKMIADTIADVKAVQDNTPKDFEIILGKTKYTERVKAAEALKRGLANAPRNGTHIKIGSYKGLGLYYTSSFDKGTHFILKGSGEYSALGGDSASGNITRITNLAEKIRETLEVDKALVTNYKAEIETLKKEVNAEFPRAQELEELQAKLNDIDTRLGINVSTVDMSGVIVDDEAGDGDAESSKDLTGNDGTSRWTTERVEGSKDRDVTLSDIVHEIREKFDIPISSGKVTDREASGIYKKQAEAIRTRISNNLPTVSHELGHHLDKRYELSLLESVGEMKDVVSGEFLDQYPADKINGELVAEFVRLYLQNTNEANRLCPGFYSDFIGALSKEDLKALNEIASSVNEYMSYDISKKYESSIVSSKKAKKLRKGRMKDKTAKFYTDWVYGFYPIKKLTDFVEETVGETLPGSKSMYMLADNSLNAHVIANYVVTEGFRDLNGNILDDKKSFIECLRGIRTRDKKSVADFDLYLKLKHALEINSQGKRTFADEVLENQDNIRREIARLEKEHPEFRQTAEDIYEYQYNMLKYFAVPSGLLTMREVEYLREKYPCYVPFYRFVDGKKGGSFARTAFAKQDGLIKRLKGSGLDTLSPLESIVRNTEKIVKASLRHQTAVVLAEYADTVDGIGQFIEKVPPDMIPHNIDITAWKEDFTDKLQQIVSSAADYGAVSKLLDDVFGNNVTDFTPVVNENKKIISVLRNGERSYYQIHDTELFKAVTELSPKQTSGILYMVGKMMRVTNALITQFNPVFAIRNPIKDFATAYDFSEIDNPVEFITSYVETIIGMVTKSESYKQYRAMGGGYSAELTVCIEDISKTLRRVAEADRGKAMRIALSLLHPIELISSLNSFNESIPRVMEFQRVLKKTGDLQEAIHAADDITTNFKRHGASAAAKVANNVFRFPNAHAQGIDKTRRVFTDTPIIIRRKIIRKWILKAILISILTYFYNKIVDEEGYKNLSSYKKNNFYNFAIGDGKFISLPKERENAILHSLTERVIDKMIGGDENAFYDFGGYLSMQLLPPMFPDTLNPVDAVHSVLNNTIIGGPVDIGFNRDFKGTPIEGEYDKYLPSNERYTESTTKLAYGLGQTKLARDLDMSPKKIDHLISFYLGSLGDMNQALFPMNDNRRDISLGLRNKFISDSNYSTDVLNRMYENKEKAERAYSYCGTIDTAVEYEKNAIMTSYISEMNKAIRALPEEEQRNGRKYLLKSLNNWKYDNSVSQSTMLDRLSEQKNIEKGCIVTDLPGSCLEWTKNKKKYSYQLSPREYTEYVNDYLSLLENYRNYQNRKGNDSEYLDGLEEAKVKAKKNVSEKYKNKYASKAHVVGE